MYINKKKLSTGVLFAGSIFSFSSVEAARNYNDTMFNVIDTKGNRISEDLSVYYNFTAFRPDGGVDDDTAIEFYDDATFNDDATFKGTDIIKDGVTYKFLGFKLKDGTIKKMTFEEFKKSTYGEFVKYESIVYEGPSSPKVDITHHFVDEEGNKLLDNVISNEENVIKNEIEKDGKRYVFVRTEKISDTESKHIYKLKKGRIIVNHYKEGTTDKVFDQEIIDNLAVGENYYTRPAYIAPKINDVDGEDEITRTSVVLENIDEPNNANGIVTTDDIVVNYYYKEITITDKIKKFSKMIVNYLKDGTEEKLIDSKVIEKAKVGENYSETAPVIEPKKEVDDNDERTIIRTKTYELINNPLNASGVITEQDQIINFYYKETVKEDVVKKKSFVTVNYYKEGTEEKVADSKVLSDLDVGSDYSTNPKNISSKFENEELEDKSIYKTYTYELVKNPENASGKVTKDGIVVNYYYRENVKEDVIPRKASEPIINYKRTGYHVDHIFDKEEKSVKGSVFDSLIDTLNGVSVPFVGVNSLNKIYHLDGKPGVGGNREKSIIEAENKIARLLGFKDGESARKDEKLVNLDFNKNDNFVYDLEYDKISGPIYEYEGYDSKGFYMKLASKVNYDENGNSYLIANNPVHYKSNIPEGAEIEVSKLTYKLEPEREEKEISLTEENKWSRKLGTMQPDKTTYFTYYYKLKKFERVGETSDIRGSVVVKYVDDNGNKIKDDVVFNDNLSVAKKITKEIVSGTRVLDTKSEIESSNISYDTTLYRDNTIVKDGITYKLVEVLPTGDVYNNTVQEKGLMKEGATTIVYKYVPVKKENVVVNYYKDGTKEKLADSDIIEKQDVGSDYTTRAKIIEPKTKILENSSVTLSYRLLNTPENAHGKVSDNGVNVDYYYEETSEEVENIVKDGVKIKKVTTKIGNNPSKVIYELVDDKPKVSEIDVKGLRIKKTTVYTLNNDTGEITSKDSYESVNGGLTVIKVETVVENGKVIRRTHNFKIDPNTGDVSDDILDEVTGDAGREEILDKDGIKVRKIIIKEIGFDGNIVEKVKYEIIDSEDPLKKIVSENLVNDDVKYNKVITYILNPETGDVSIKIQYKLVDEVNNISKINVIKENGNIIRRTVNFKIDEVSGVITNDTKDEILNKVDEGEIIIKDGVYISKITLREVSKDGEVLSKFRYEIIDGNDKTTKDVVRELNKDGFRVKEIITYKLNSETGELTKTINYKFVENNDNKIIKMENIDSLGKKIKRTITYTLNILNGDISKKVDDEVIQVGNFGISTGGKSSFASGFSVVKKKLAAYATSFTIRTLKR